MKNGKDKNNKGKLLKSVGGTDKLKKPKSASSNVNIPKPVSGKDKKDNKLDVSTNVWIDTDEIRRNKKTRHFSWVFAKKGYKRKSVGLTHSKYYNGSRNISLSHNPNPNDVDIITGKPKKAFANKDIQIEGLDIYDKNNKCNNGWYMGDNDKIKLRKIFTKKKKGKPDNNFKK